MKKSIISIALCVALVLSSMCAMFVMPASAANGVDFLGAAIEVSDGATAEIVDGNLVFTATAAGQEVHLIPEAGVNLNEYPIWEGTLTADMPFDICWNDANNGKWIFGAGDFCYNFAGNQGAGSPLAAGSEDVKFSLTGAYTWNGSPLPANAEIVQTIFIAKAPGTITVSKCMLTDGIEDISINSASYDEADEWNTYESVVSTDAADWTPAANNAGLTSEIIIENDADGNLVLGNTAGTWPAAYQEVAMTIPYEGSAIYFDFSVTSQGQTTVYLFFGDATETDFEGAGKGYYTVVGDVQAGNYTGYVYLEDMGVDHLVDENGNITISVVKAFGTTAGGGAATVEKAFVLRDITACYNVENVEPETYVTYTVESQVADALAAGDEITVDVTATAADDVAGFKFALSFDSALFAYADTAWGTAAAGLAATTDAMVLVNEVEADGVTTVYFSVLALEGTAIAEGDVLASVTLTAKDAVEGIVDIAISETEVVTYDSIINDYELVAEGVSGTIEFVAPAFELGDANGDGEVDIFDAQKIFQYVNEVITADDLDMVASDVTGDGEVDIYDAQKVFQYVNEVITEL